MIQLLWWLPTPEGFLLYANVGDFAYLHPNYGLFVPSRLEFDTGKFFSERVASIFRNWYNV